MDDQPTFRKKTGKEELSREQEWLGEGLAFGTAVVVVASFIRFIWPHLPSLGTGTLNDILTVVFSCFIFPGALIGLALALHPPFTLFAANITRLGMRRVCGGLVVVFEVFLLVCMLVKNAPLG